LAKGVEKTQKRRRRRRTCNKPKPGEKKEAT
jgi:hypothetical protein